VARDRPDNAIGRKGVSLLEVDRQIFSDRSEDGVDDELELRGGA
jgi:hypothetical protein